MFSVIMLLLLFAGEKEARGYRVVEDQLEIRVVKGYGISL